MAPERNKQPYQKSLPKQRILPNVVLISPPIICHADSNSLLPLCDREILFREMAMMNARLPEGVLHFGENALKEGHASNGEERLFEEEEKRLSFHYIVSHKTKDTEQRVRGYETSVISLNKRRFMAESLKIECVLMFH
ncbi:hypothetical protein HZH66_010137 [Vespula vulgaris]|uniref:Uncharacterized protein n=1 Tax=Vespula vulgaris TaxID=7454 RepID=A0A834MYA0_VESVU|nr:hypothetical protein HZH66_010137 [Vespula vulgaris]